MQARQYNINAEFNVTVRCLMAIAYILPEDIKAAFDESSENEFLPDELIAFMNDIYIGNGCHNKKRYMLYGVRM